MFSLDNKSLILFILSIICLIAAIGFAFFAKHSHTDKKSIGIKRLALIMVFVLAIAAIGFFVGGYITAGQDGRENEANSESFIEAPNIDSAIIGRWSNSEGEYFEFNRDGTFESNVRGNGVYTAKSGELSLNPDSYSHTSYEEFWYVIDGNRLHINYSTSSTPQDAEHSMYSLSKE